MFTKKPENGAATAEAAKAALGLGTPRPATPPPNPQALVRALAAQAPTGRGSPSVIGPDLSITGNMTSKGEVHIDGEVQGDVHGQRIVVGQSARITGGLIAEDVIVQGTVMGSIRGMRVTLQASSKVDGDIFHQSLAIEQGAFFEGKSRRADDPMSAGKSNGVAAGGMPTPAVN